jgi:hypothetical protein
MNATLDTAGYLITKSQKTVQNDHPYVGVDGEGVEANTDRGAHDKAS